MTNIHYDFDTPIERRGTDSAKWHKYRHKDIIPMWVADMDFSSPPPVLEALHRRIDHGVFGYAVASTSAAESIVSYLSRSFDWQIKPSWLVWLPGVVTGLNVACRSVGCKDDEVLTTVPVYPPFLSAPSHSRRRLTTTQMVYSEHGWQIDFEDVDRLMGDDTAMFILCNPQNPTGRVFNRDELEELARICQKHDVVICSDEIHCDLVLNNDTPHTPMAAISDEIAQNTITLMAPSKTYNIPGLSCSFAVIPNADMRRRFKQAMAGIVPHVNVMGLTALEAAYNHGQHWLEAARRYLRDNHHMVWKSVNAINGLSMKKAQATYLAWIDAGKLNARNPARFFEKAGVGLSDGSDFGAPGYVRLNFGCSRHLLQKALERMASAAASQSGQVQ